MKCRVSRNNGFRPVYIRLRLDNPVELAVFKAMMALNESIPSVIVKEMGGVVKAWAGVGNLGAHDVKACAKSILDNFNKRLP